jgi:hypothetical protein
VLAGADLVRDAPGQLVGEEAPHLVAEGFFLRL